MTIDTGELVDLSDVPATQLPSGVWLPVRATVDYALAAAHLTPALAPMPAPAPVPATREPETVVVDVEAVEVPARPSPPPAPAPRPAKAPTEKRSGGWIRAAGRTIAAVASAIWASAEALIIGTVAALAFATSADNLLGLGDLVEVAGWHAWVVAGTQEVLASYAFLEFRRRSGWAPRLLPLAIFSQAAAFLILANLASVGHGDAFEHLPWHELYLAMPPVVFLELALLWETKTWSKKSQPKKSKPQRKGWFQGSSGGSTVNPPANPSKGSTGKSSGGSTVNPRGGSSAVGVRVQREPSKGVQRGPAGTLKGEPSGRVQGRPRKRANEQRQQAVARWRAEGFTRKQIEQAGADHYGASESQIKRDYWAARDADEAAS